MAIICPKPSYHYILISDLTDPTEMIDIEIDYDERYSAWASSFWSAPPPRGGPTGRGRTGHFVKLTYSPFNVKMKKNQIGITIYFEVDDLDNLFSDSVFSRTSVLSFIPGGQKMFVTCGTLMSLTWIICPLEIIQIIYWKRKIPLKPHVRPLAWHYFLKLREFITFHCSCRSICSFFLL